jgi:hypothetical protein
MFRVVGQFVEKYALPLSVTSIALSIGAHSRAMTGAATSLSTAIEGAGLTDSLRSEIESTLRTGLKVQLVPYGHKPCPFCGRNHCSR